MFTTDKENNLEGNSFQSGATGTTYDGGGFVLDLDGANRTAYLETLVTLTLTLALTLTLTLSLTLTLHLQPN